MTEVHIGTQSPKTAKLKFKFDIGTLSARELDEMSKVIDEFRDFVDKISETKYFIDSLDSPIKILEMTDSDRECLVFAKRREVTDVLYDILSKHVHFVEK